MDQSLKNAPIGVTDSGVGGLTVVRELQKLLPGEDIVYFGDGANCPYGNRSREELETLLARNVAFLRERGVKAVVVACNTTSALVDSAPHDFGVPLFTIIAPAAQAVKRCGVRKVGLLATEFTVRSGCYEKRIHALCPDVQLVAKGSPSLAGLIDGGAFDDAAINAEIFAQVGDIIAREPVTHLILGCTHYPIVEENFRACFPFVQLIDPAREEALAVSIALSAENLVRPAAAGERGRFEVYTSGDPAVYEKVAARLRLFPPDKTEKLSVESLRKG